MKTKDVKPGVVYAYRQGDKWGQTVPVAVVTTEYLYSRRKGVSGYHRRSQTGGRPSLRPDGYSSQPMGFLAASFDRPEYIKAIAGDRDVETLARVARQFQGAPEQVELKDGAGAQLNLIDTRYILGEWDTVMAEAEIADQAARERKAAKDAASQARVAAARQRVDALRALGLPDAIAQPTETWNKTFSAGTNAAVDEGSWSGNTNGVRLTWDQVDALLSLIPEGARYEPPVAPQSDEWEYQGPEGEKGATVHVKDEEAPAPEPEKPKRRTTGKSRVFVISTHVVQPEHMALLGVPERSQRSGTLHVCAPTKAAVEELLIERGWKPVYAERLAKESKMSPLDVGWEIHKRMVEAGLLGETVRDVLVTYNTGADGVIGRYVTKDTMEIAGNFRRRKTGAQERWIEVPRRKRH
jgi:hypothetical protein